MLNLAWKGVKLCSRLASKIQVNISHVIRLCCARTRRLNFTHFFLITVYFIACMQAKMVKRPHKKWCQVLCHHESRRFLFVRMNQFHLQVIPGFVWCCIQFTDCSAPLCCSKDPVHFIDVQQRTGRAVRWEHTAPFSGGSSASDAWLSQLTILTWAFHPLSDHTAGGPHGIASLKANKHLSTSKQIPHAFNKNIHASLVEPRSQRPAGRCNNGSS